MGLSLLWSQFWHYNSPPLKTEAKHECHRLSEAVLDELVPEPPWEAAANNLAIHLNPWLADPSPGSLVRAVIGPPGSGVQEVVRRWGKQVSAKLVHPPDFQYILDPTLDFWPDVARDADRVLVIPELERFYLRHADGLSLIRRLAEWLWVNPHRVVVGCSSWAWAYFCRKLQIEAVFKTPIALEPLDADALRAWFCPRHQSRYLVQTIEKKRVIYPVDVSKTTEVNQIATAADDQESNDHGADIFERIAATSRGIPEIAMALWRECLCEGEAEANDHGSRTVVGSMTPIHVRPPQSLVLPALPKHASTREAIVLHTLLLHAGLPSEILFQVVPFTALEVIATLSTLQEAELISEHEGVWKVTLLAYYSVRTFIRAESLLIDLF